MKTNEQLVFLISLIVMELTSAIIGFGVWKKIKQTHWRWFPFFLLFLSVAESIAVYISFALKYFELNRAIYRVVVSVEFIFFFWLFIQYLKPYGRTKLIYIVLAIYVLSLAADLLYFIKEKYFFSSFSYSVGNILLLVVIAYFLLNFIKSNEIINYRTSMMFWVAVGLLIFYLGTFPFHAFRNTLILHYKSMFYTLWRINFIPNYLMYISFILAFLWGKPK